MKYGSALIYCITTCFLATCVGGAPQIALPGTSISELASTNEKTRREAVASLLRDGPVRIEEIWNAERNLQQILEMHRRLNVPRRDWRSGHLRKEEETGEAIEFFMSFDAVLWIIDGLRHGDIITESQVSLALAGMDQDTRNRHKGTLLAELPPLFNRIDIRSSTDATDSKRTRARIVRLVAELLDITLPPSKDDSSINWDAESARVAKAADEWLMRDREQTK